MPIQIDLGVGSSNSDSNNKKPSDKNQHKNNGPVLGIDLGTTNSLVAYVSSEGRAEVIRDKSGHAMLPSVLRFDSTGKMISSGQEARENRGAHHELTVFSVKRLMGRSYEDVKEESALFPFEVLSDETGSQVLIKAGERKISPVEVSSEILKTLKLRAEKTLGEKIDRAVITVPAYFDDAQRSATKAAGRLAGLNVIRVVNEPTAAALAYGWSNERPGRIAVYDLGGGTFDISLLRIEENVFEVLATAGDTHLGGDDFDWEIANWALSKLAEKRPEQKPKTQDEQKKLIAELLSEAERVKVELTTKDSVEYVIRDLKFLLTRSEVEKLWMPLVNRTLESCQRAMLDSKLTVKDFDDVILVGGATRIPLVRSVVQDFFKRVPNISLNPDEAVALGAALQAKNLSGQGGDRLLLDVIPLSLGLETMGGTVSKLIPRNSTIPTEAREVFTNHVENQTAFDFHILQGERELVQDSRSLAKFKLRGLDPAPAGFHRIEVLFRVDANGILNVRARDLRSGKAQEIEVRPSFGMTDQELERMLESSIESAESDMQARQLIDLRIEAEAVLQAAERSITRSGHLVSASELLEIKARLVDLKNASKGTSLEGLQKAMDEFNDVTQNLAEIQVNSALQSNLQGKKV